MKVIDVLCEACSFLGLSDEEHLLQETKKLAGNTEEKIESIPSSESENVLETLNDFNQDAFLDENGNIKKLFNLLQFSLRELCSNYLCVCVCCEIKSKNQMIDLELLDNFIRINEVSFAGTAVKYKIFNKKINLPFDGLFTVKYYTYPTINNLFDKVDNFGVCNFDVVVTGLCAYYCLAVGRFDEFNNFHQQYVERAEGLKTLKAFLLPLRRWE